MTRITIDMKMLISTTTNISHDQQESENMHAINIAVGVAATALVVLLVISLIVGLSLLLLYRQRRFRGETDSTGKEETSTYSILTRGVEQQAQAQDLTGLYDQICLSPSTGQTELISDSERETIKDALSTPTSNIYLRIDEKYPQPISTSKTGKIVQANAT